MNVFRSGHVTFLMVPGVHFQFTYVHYDISGCKYLSDICNRICTVF